MKLNYWCSRIASAMSCAALAATYGCGTAEDHGLFDARAAASGDSMPADVDEPGDGVVPAAPAPAASANDAVEPASTTSEGPPGSAVLLPRAPVDQAPTAPSDTPSMEEEPSGPAGEEDPDPGEGGGAVVTEPEPPLPVPCELGEFATPEKVTGLALPGPFWGPALAASDTSLFFAAGSGDDEHIFVAARAGSAQAEFAAAEAVAELVSNASDGTPFASASGQRLYFYSTRQGGRGSRDLWVAERANLAARFDRATPLRELNSAGADHLPRLSADELSIAFTSNRAGGEGNADIWRARRGSIDAPFGEPENFAELNTRASETAAWLSPDGLTVLFSSDRDGGQGRQDLWRATRASAAQRFDPPVAVAALNSTSDEIDVALSSSGHEVFFSSDRDGVAELWRSVRSCR